MNEIWRGTLKKMHVEPGPDGEPARYALTDGHWQASERVVDHPLNGFLGGELELEHTGAIHCIYCGRATKKSFNQGFCYPCFQARAEADQCIVRPELCHYHDDANPCRDEDFAHRHCFAPHVLYVSLTSG